MCDQQRLRPACAYAQSDQSLCQSLEYSMIVKQLTEHHLEFLSFKGGCTGSSESTLAKMPHCWKSHATAQFLSTVYQSAHTARQYITVVLCLIILLFYIKFPSENRTGIPTGSRRDPTGILNPGGIPPGY